MRRISTAAYFTSYWPTHSPPIPLPPATPVTLPLPPSSPKLPPLTFRLSPCLTISHSFWLTSSPSFFPCLCRVSVSSLLGLCVWRGRLNNSPPSPTFPAPLLLPLPSVPPTQADLARCCPDGSEPGRAQGPGRGRRLIWPARPCLDGCVGCLHYCLHPPQQ